MSTVVCSTTHLFHTLLNPVPDLLDSILSDGLRPLSDFPDSERWQMIQKHRPGMFRWIYEEWGRPILGHSYANSGIFVSPIDFQLLPDSPLFNRTRVRIPLERVDREQAFLTYEWQGERVSRPLTPEALADTAALWTAENVVDWFARDNSRIFYYVPQVAIYQGRIAVTAEDIESWSTT